MSITIDVEKEFGKIQHLFKNPQQTRNVRKFPQPQESMCEISTAETGLH